MKDKYLILIYFLIFLFFAVKAPFVVSAFIIGFYFFIIVESLANFLEKIFKKKLVSNILSYAIVFGIIVYLFLSVIPMFINEAKNLFTFLSNYSFQTKELPEELSNIVSDLNSNISAFVLNITNYLLGVLPSFLTSLTILIVTIIGIGGLKKYLLKRVTYLFSEDKVNGRKFLESFYLDILKMVRGQMSVAILTSLTIFVMLSLFKIPNAFFISILAFITDFIPFVGLLITAVPSLIIGFYSNGLKGMILVLIVLFIANQLESWVYGPKIQSDNLKLHWFLIVLLITLFGTVFGFVGVLLAIPTFVFFKNYYKFYII